MTKKSDGSNITLVQKLSRPVSWRAFMDVMTHDIQVGTGNKKRKLDFADLDGEAERLLTEARQQALHSGIPVKQVLSSMGVLSEDEASEQASNRRALLNQLGWESLSGEWSSVPSTELPALPGAERAEKAPHRPIQLIDEVIGLRRLQESLSHITLDELSQMLAFLDVSDPLLLDRLNVCKVIQPSHLEDAKTAISEDNEGLFWLLLLSCGADPERMAMLIESSSWYPITHEEQGDLADYLTDNGLITFRQFKSYMSARRERQRPTEEALAELVGRTDKLTEVLSSVFGYPIAKMDEFPIVTEIDSEKGISTLRVFNIVPLSLSENDLAFGSKRPLSSLENSMLEEHFGPFRFFLLTFADYEARRAEIKYQLSSSRHADARQKAKEIVMIREMITNASAVRLVEDMFERALAVGATDIHLEHQHEEFRVRYRVDSILQEAMTIHPELADEVISRIKILAGMDITERRLPQDGHIKVVIGGNDVYMRVATVPTYRGERISIRLLNSGQVQLSLEEIGLEGEELRKFDLMTQKPYGMILTTGPVGSGKTTTLYSALSRLNQPERNILTIEDPVEYELNGINQIEVNYRLDFGFSEGLRSILRQDPNTILVGEIRDHETAAIAVRASMTGMLVFSSLHTNDAAGAITTFYNFQIAPLLVANSLLGVVAQRLVRRLCPDCRELYTPTDEECIPFRTRGLISEDEPLDFLARATGCSECNFTGYRGRVGIFELMEITPKIRELIMDSASEREIRDAAMDNGMVLLADSALKKALQHVTSLEDISRVVFL